MDINVRSIFLATKRGGDHAEAGGGVIINLARCSKQVKRTTARTALQGAVKFHGLLSAEFGNMEYVNAMCP